MPSHSLAARASDTAPKEIGIFGAKRSTRRNAHGCQRGHILPFSNYVLYRYVELVDRGLSRCDETRCPRRSRTRPLARRGAVARAHQSASYISPVLLSSPAVEEFFATASRRRSRRRRCSTRAARGGGGTPLRPPSLVGSSRVRLQLARRSVDDGRGHVEGTLPTGQQSSHSPPPSFGTFYVA